MLHLTSRLPLGSVVPFRDNLHLSHCSTAWSVRYCLSIHQAVKDGNGRACVPCDGAQGLSISRPLAHTYSHTDSIVCSTVTRTHARTHARTHTETFATAHTAYTWGSYNILYVHMHTQHTHTKLHAYISKHALLHTHTHAPKVDVWHNFLAKKPSNPASIDNNSVSSDVF